MRLSELSPGAPFVVSRVLMGGEIGKRLADMGFTDGATGLLVRGAFMRGPIQVRIRGYDLLLRRGEAKLIEVEPEVIAGGEDTTVSADEGSRARGGRGHGAGRGAKWRGPGGRRGTGSILRSLFSEPDCCGSERKAEPRAPFGGKSA
ncbi:MAG: FeoA family protein [Spirochaetales bacterium]|jgi:Fe2+ transport system protein FeoA